MKKRLAKKAGFIKIMKFSLSQCLWAAFFLGTAMAHDGRGQEALNRSITLHLRNTEVNEALIKIENLAGVEFIYSPVWIGANRKVNLKVRNQKLSEVLKQLLEPLEIDYKAYGNRIVLSAHTQKESSSINNGSLPKAQTTEMISGKVTNVAGEALPGVSILVKATNRGTITEADGSFKMNAEKGEILVFSFVGFKSKEVTVMDNSPVQVALEDDNTLLADVVVVGSRSSIARTDIDRPVPVDVISTKELQSTGQVDLGQSIHYSAPSFNAVKFGINDMAPLVDPASLRGLGPDQVLVLVNNKRRHKVSFLSINDGVGKGQVGTDMNIVPTLALKRVEVLRNGAAAIYGSDAIGGVINMELNDADHGGTVRAYTGVGYSKPNLDINGVIPPKTISDGFTYSLSANLGLKLTKKGFLNTTIQYAHTEPYDRSGIYKSSAGFYVKDPVEDAALVAKNGINLNRAILGSAENTTYGIFYNAGINVSEKWKVYSFGGYTNKYVIGGIFTRPPSNTKRNDLSIFPNGFNPIVPSTLNDFSIVAGAKGILGNEWRLDVSAGQGLNHVRFENENTVNPSLGADSPTKFYTGTTQITQTTVNADLTKTFNSGNYPNFSLSTGTELRRETYTQKQGDRASWIAGPLTGKDVGSTGREGFSDKTAGTWDRTNVGVYVDAESDITRSLLVGAAVRFENYSDFGSNLSYKLNSRLKLAEPIAIRASLSRGFRAPSMTQSHYSNYANISFANDGSSIVRPVIPATSDLAKLLGVDGLKPETSMDYSAGVTSKIGEHFTFTADAYQIDIDNRVMLSGSIDVSKIPQFVAAGYTQEANVFVNALDTRTKGIEFVANYHTPVGTDSKIGINAAFSSMSTSIRANRETSTGINVVNQIAAIFITDGQPKSKLILSANYDYKKVGFLVRASRFGQVSDPTATLKVAPSDPTAIKYQQFDGKVLTDFAFTYKPTKRLSFTTGVNNLFDIYPDLLQMPQTNNEIIYSRTTNQFGTQGRFVHLSVNYSF